MIVEAAQEQDGVALAELRVLAMRESLEALGRFDPERARHRFLSNYLPESTFKVIVDSNLCGFFAVSEFPEYLYIDHLYVHPDHQGKKIGSIVLTEIIRRGQKKEKLIKLGALKQSRSNQFYMAHGFVKTHEGEYDNYYELKPKL